MAANSCHPSDTNPTQQNQRWSVTGATPANITEKKSGKCLVATAPRAGAGVAVATCSTAPRETLLQWNGGTISLPHATPPLCVDTTPPPPPPPPPSVAAVNAFTLPPTPPGDGGGNGTAGTLPALLVPIVLGGGKAAATLTINLAPTRSELGW